MEASTLYKIIGGVAVFLASFIKIPKLEVNIWKWIGNNIVKSLTQNIISKLDELSKKVLTIENSLQEHLDEEEKEKARCSRQRIVRFNNEIVDGKKHTQESFDDILDDIDMYEDYCRSNPLFPNNKANISIENIKRIYKKCLEENSFLK